jgi:hypothetical protein
MRRVGGGLRPIDPEVLACEHRQNDSIFPARAANHQRFVDALAAAGSRADGANKKAGARPAFVRQSMGREDQ